MKNILLLALTFLHLSNPLTAQLLKPGFDNAELTEAICISARTGSAEKYYTDSHYIAPPLYHKRAYRSAEIGLMNLWELWTNDRKSAIISIRGTTPNPESWLENFYAAMVPAKGTLNLSEKDTFHYQLSSDDKAAVHVGWLIGTAFLVKEIVPKIDSCYQAGIKDFIITGHSQGGALSYLVTAYLLDLREKGILAADVQFKTYCSAAPKPGNLYFAYDFEYRMKPGMAFNIINEKDWVPEVPVSIQTTNDFNEVSPFKFIRATIKKQKFPQNLALKHVYKKLDRPTKKAQKHYEKYLGKMLTKEVSKKINGLKIPEFYHSNHYVRTGTPIILKPDAEYYIRFGKPDAAIFQHHMHHPYLFLIDKSKLEKPKP